MAGVVVVLTDGEDFVEGAVLTALDARTLPLAGPDDVATVMAAAPAPAPMTTANPAAVFLRFDQRRRREGKGGGGAGVKGGCAGANWGPGAPWSSMVIISPFCPLLPWPAPGPFADCPAPS